MRHEDKIRLQHMLEEAEVAVEFAEGLSFQDFVKDKKTVRAIIRSIEIIGEAAARISSDYKDEHQDIEWKQIVGMRNHLVHIYFDIDFKTVWSTIKDDIPELLRVLQTLLAEE